MHIRAQPLVANPGNGLLKEAKFEQEIEVVNNTMQCVTSYQKCQQFPKAGPTHRKQVAKAKPPASDKN